MSVLTQARLNNSNSLSIKNSMLLQEEKVHNLESHRLQHAQPLAAFAASFCADLNVFQVDK